VGGENLRHGVVGVRAIELSFATSDRLSYSSVQSYQRAWISHKPAENRKKDNIVSYS